MNKINFQNGSLVSKAKVTIDGTVYEVEPAEYEGTTPLNAENLNQMQDNIIQGIYPVGSIYMSTVSTNPSTLFGFGTWQLWGSGKVPVGIDTDDTDFNDVEKTGGTKRQALRALIGATNSNTTKLGYKAEGAVPSESYSIVVNGVSSDGLTSQVNHSTKVTDLTGNDVSIVQPYITCYMWKRIN